MTVDESALFWVRALILSGEDRNDPDIEAARHMVWAEYNRLGGMPSGWQVVARYSRMVKEFNLAGTSYGVWETMV